MGQSVLITGANGFIGSYTTLLFESLGYRVIPCGRKHKRSKDLSLLPIKVSTIMLDVTDYIALQKLSKEEKVTHIVHVAQPGRGEDPKALELTFRAMHNILEVAKNMRMQKVIFTSSGAIYGQLRKEDRTPIKENDPVAIYPTFIYRSSKIVGEWLGDFYAQHHGVDFVALRVSSVYGPGQSKGIGAAVKSGILGRECRPYLTRIPDDLIFVKDVAQAIHLACFCERPKSRAYNIASGKPYFENDLEEAIRKQLPASSFVIGKHPEAAALGVHRQRDILDTTLAKDELGFTPEFDLNSGIVAIVEWVRENKVHLN